MKFWAMVLVFIGLGCFRESFQAFRVKEYATGRGYIVIGVLFVGGGLWLFSASYKS